MARTNLIEVSNISSMRSIVCPAASDPMMIPLLLAFGLNEFSMSSSAILKARKMITGYSEAELQAVADKAMSFVSAKEIENFMRDFINQ